MKIARNFRDTGLGRKSEFNERIGLIGGLAFRAGVFYYEQILQRYNAQARPLDLLLCHADVDKVLRYVGVGAKRSLGDYLGALANDLFEAGANVVAVTAVAPHLAIEELSHVARGPVVNVLDAITAGLEAAGLDRVAIFGNRVVMQTNVMGAVHDDLVVPLEPSLVESVHAMYSDIALHGKRGTPHETEYFDRLARNLIKEHGVQGIVLAGTDLSSFYAERPPDYPFLDVAQLHIEQIVSFT
jgi:aspartate/glutamate racemase